MNSQQTDLLARFFILFICFFHRLWDYQNKQSKPKRALPLFFFKQVSYVWIFATWASVKVKAHTLLLGLANKYKISCVNVLLFYNLFNILKSQIVRGEDTLQIYTSNLSYCNWRSKSLLIRVLISPGALNEFGDNQQGFSANISFG